MWTFLQRALRKCEIDASEIQAILRNSMPQAHDELVCSYHVSRRGRILKSGTIYCSDARQDNSADTTLYGMGSLIKILIVLCLWRMIHETDQLRERSPYKYLGWDKSVSTIINSLWNANREESVDDARLPRMTLRELLCHFNALPAMQPQLFAPDETFLMSEERLINLLRSGSLGNMRSTGYAYSNLNFIIAAYIIKLVTRKSLKDSLEEIVLMPYQMNNTFLCCREDESQQHLIDQKAKLAVPLFAASKNRVIEIDKRYSLRDLTELATCGGFTCAEDIANLLKKIDRINLEEQFIELDLLKFFSEISPQKGGFGSSMLGLQSELNSDALISQSPEREFGGPGKQRYRLPKSSLLRRMRRGKLIACAKAGSILGYSSHYLFVPEERVIIVVLTNASGAADPSIHIGQYLLQQTFGLKNLINFAAEAGQIRGNILSYKAQEGLEWKRFEPVQGQERQSLCGTYIHNITGHSIVIGETDDGIVANFYEDGLLMDVRRVSIDRYIISRHNVAAIDRYSLEFGVDSGVLRFRGAENGAEKDIYLRTET